MLSPSQPTKEVSILLTTADARLIVAALYTAQETKSLGLSVDQANRAGILITAIHGAIWRALRRSRDSELSSTHD